MSIAATIKEAEANLKQAGIKTARLDALVLLEQVTGKSRAWLLAHPEFVISTLSRKSYENLIKERVKRVPLTHLIGKQEFWGLEFKVTPDVLIPRPESETIVEYALRFQGSTLETSVLDVGTGCGCIAIAIAKERPHWSVSATDVSDAALKVAKSNAKKHGVTINFLYSNLFEAINKLNDRSKNWERFDVVTANLPYVKHGHKRALTDEAKKEPALALFGGQDGLDLYQKFFDQVPQFTKPDGLVIIEADPWQHKDLIKLAESAGFKLKDHARFVLAFTA